MVVAYVQEVVETEEGWVGVCSPSTRLQQQTNVNNSKEKMESNSSLLGG